MTAPAAFSICRWTTSERLGDIMAMIHDAFSGFAPPSGVLKETVADLAARQRDGLVLVAQDHERFIGSMFCASKGDAFYLTRLATAPDWRRRGVGRALMGAAESEARAARAVRLTLRVRVTLPDNLAYFRKLAFVVTGQGLEDGRTQFYTMERPLG